MRRSRPSFVETKGGLLQQDKKKVLATRPIGRIGTRERLVGFLCPDHVTARYRVSG